jgi:hypothetical protein
MVPDPKAILESPTGRKRFSSNGFDADMTVTLRNLYTNFADQNAILAADNAWDLKEMLAHRSPWVIDAVLEDLVESARELAILDVLTGAKILAEGSNPGYHKALRNAFEIADLELGENYKCSAGRYLWLEKAAKDIIAAYIANQKMV